MIRSTVETNTSDVTVNLSALKSVVSPLDSNHLLRPLVMSLPKQMAIADYVAIVPVLWELVERS